jgi:hypothetical protein
VLNLRFPAVYAVAFLLGEKMTDVSMGLNYPLVTNFGGVSWLSDLRKASGVQDVSHVYASKAGLLETQATLVGSLQDYALYFLTSRPRVRLAKMASGAYIENSETSGVVCAEIGLTCDVSVNPPVAQPRWKAKITVTSELEKILQSAANVKTKVTGIGLPAASRFPTGLQFDFKCGRSLSMNISPGLWKFIEVLNPDSAFFENMNFCVHYIGQTTRDVESRLNAHEKIRLLSHRLLTRDLDDEAVVFAFTFRDESSDSLESTFKLDLIEAGLISIFKPPLNIDFKNFPEGGSPKELFLRKCIAKEGVSTLTLQPPPSISVSSHCSLNNGVFFTREGDVIKKMDKPFTYSLS